MELQERDFLLPLHLVRKLQILAFLIKGNFFAFLTDNSCDNALDSANGILDVKNLPDGTYCQWLISSQENNGYVILEFQSFMVRKN